MRYKRRNKRKFFHDGLCLSFILDRHKSSPLEIWEGARAPERTGDSTGALLAQKSAGAWARVGESIHAASLLGEFAAAV